jgi:hypothetical protein
VGAADRDLAASPVGAPATLAGVALAGLNRRGLLRRGDDGRGRGTPDWLRLRPLPGLEQAVALAELALVIGVPAGIVYGRLGWLIFAHQLGITPVLAVPSAELPVMAPAGWPRRW